MEAYQHDTQIDLIDFRNNQVKIYGDMNSPYIKCSDLLIRILGYTKSNDARWFRNISAEQKQIYIMDGVTPSFNEQGIYWALMKSNKPIAQQFQLAVCNKLKQIRLQAFAVAQQQRNQLEEANQVIAALRAPRAASIYHIKHRGELLYVGLDRSKAQTRPQQHLTERKKIISTGHQLIDIYLSTIPAQEIEFTFIQCDSNEAIEKERRDIEQLNPKYNVAMNGSEYICMQCDPTKTYVNRGYYENHMHRYHIPQ